MTKIICILVRKGKEEESWFPLPRSSRFKNIARENCGVQLEAVVLFEYGKEDGL